MLGHIDVVNANRADWTRDPFVLLEEKRRVLRAGRLPT